ncbi:zinc-binding alcohol dehydrogenase [Planctomonas sp. JC2975]|uniref:zinc-dependent alcohol dehydrogenase n=1 Tax=Planctomonas sp. JC2975 TaxID=2729626 RepID=UPI001474136D|nr:zinc-binding alcohol dehydrogenase [Planctomonas sp. JC2975]NNC13612.1 zinc-binding alcohol dehydrogenase [Planctomonas sp. JC2975]
MRNTLPEGSAVHPQEADHAIALWTTGPGMAELRHEPQRQAGAGEASVRTMWTGVSRGTEMIVARGDVPQTEQERMRAPFQEGDFPFPVKYGYLNVGVVEDGPPQWRGRTVFSLHPHQSRFVASIDALVPVPDAVPARRAVLAGAVETAVNVIWDARPLIGDRVVVVGAGMIGCSVAALLRGIPGLAVTLVDIDAAKAEIAQALGARFAAPHDAPPDVDVDADADVVIEASGSAAGLGLALRLAPTDGEVVVASWYGSGEVPLELGADFHSRRLTIRSSQVGAVAPSRRGRRTTRERLALALRLLEDPAFDALLGGASGWRELPSVIASLAAGTADEMCHTIDWSAE